MKKKNAYLMVGVLLSLICASLLIEGITYTYAKKHYVPLQGVSIVLDAGHGGKDDGAQSGDIKEQAINLNITLYLKELLENAGAKVILTRDGDYDLADDSATNRKREDMKKRMELINAEDVDLFLSIHLNAYPNPSVKGAQAFYEKNNEVSKVFADIVQKYLKELTKTNMTSKVGDYYILNNANKVGALVECGFLSNAEDKAKLVQADYQKQIAQSLFNAIREYFDILS